VERSLALAVERSLTLAVERSLTLAVERFAVQQRNPRSTGSAATALQRTK
jgi:hypothetical protein